jgi:hypothetical protein
MANKHAAEALAGSLTADDLDRTAWFARYK